MQFVKVLSGENTLVHGVDHFLQERCGRKLEQIIPYRDGNKITFVLIFNDLEIDIPYCSGGCTNTTFDDKTFHKYKDSYYHRLCCPAPWHKDDPDYIEANKEFGLCSYCKQIMYGKTDKCCHPSHDITHMDRALYFHYNSLCCPIWPEAH